MKTAPLSERFDMSGRHAVVTGAASGLGLAISAALVEYGAHVTMIDRDPDGLDRASNRFGEAATAVKCDVAVVDDVAAAVAASADEHGRLDAAFVNAGIAGGPGIEHGATRLDDLDWATFDGTLAVNLRGALATIRAAATAMRPAGRGSIVVTVSTAGLRADAKVGYGYSASKGALANVVRQAAVDLAPDGIRVNGIAPGPFHTNIGGPGPADPAVERAWASTTLLARMGEPIEIQGLAVLLASDAGSFMTGAVYPVDGGTLAGWFPPVGARRP